MLRRARGKITEQLEDIQAKKALSLVEAELRKVGDRDKKAPRSKRKGRGRGRATAPSPLDPLSVEQAVGPSSPAFPAASSSPEGDHSKVIRDVIERYRATRTIHDALTRVAGLPPCEVVSCALELELQPHPPPPPMATPSPAPPGGSGGEGPHGEISGPLLSDPSLSPLSDPSLSHTFLMLELLLRLKMYGVLSTHHFDEGITRSLARLLSGDSPDQPPKEPGVLRQFAEMVAQLVLNHCTNALDFLKRSPQRGQGMEIMLANLCTQIAEKMGHDHLLGLWSPTLAPPYDPQLLMSKWMHGQTLQPPQPAVGEAPAPQGPQGGTPSKTKAGLPWRRQGDLPEPTPRAHSFPSQVPKGGGPQQQWQQRKGGQGGGRRMGGGRRGGSPGPSRSGAYRGPPLQHPYGGPPQMWVPPPFPLHYGAHVLPYPAPFAPPPPSGGPMPPALYHASGYKPPTQALNPSAEPFVPS